jgi:phosphate transport system substrate-binding protein
MHKLFRFFGIASIVTTLTITTVACGGQTEEGLTGKVEIDGSSTVFPIQEAIQEEYRVEQPGVEVTISVSGTGGGFKRFVKGDTDISNASRPIKEEEAQQAQENGIEYLEMPIAFDGLSVVVSKTNDFVKDLSIEELNKIWTGEVKKWNEVRPEFPAENIKLYGPGTDSGTFDYWNEVVIEYDEGDTITSDFSPSEDDNVIVQGVAGDRYALGFFGYAYYIENEDKLNPVAIIGDSGEAVLPTPETIETGTYSPLSRPLLVYVNKDSFVNKPQVKDYVLFLNDMAADLVAEVGYIKLPQSVYDENSAKLEELTNAK